MMRANEHRKKYNTAVWYILNIGTGSKEHYRQKNANETAAVLIKEPTILVS